MGEDRLVKWIRLFVEVFLVGFFLTLKVVAQQRHEVLPDSFQIRNLMPVLIKSKLPVAGRKGDTVMYDAAKYRTAATFRLSAMLNQMPGFRVDENGRIHFNGKEVSRIMIDGDDLTGDQYGVLTHRLKAELVKQVQVIEKHQPQKILAGIQSTNQVALNLVINQKDRNKPNVTFEPTIGLKKHELGLDLVLLGKDFKSMLFASEGNISLMQERMKNLEDGFNLWTDYSSYRLPQIYAPARDFLSSSYQLSNKSNAADLMMTVPIDTIHKLSIRARSLNRQVQSNEAEDYINFPAGNLRYKRDIASELRHAGYQGKIVLERNLNERKSSTYQLLFKIIKQQQFLQQKRTGYLSKEEYTTGEDLKQLIQLRQETFFKSRSGVMRMETGYGIESSAEVNTLTGSALQQDFKNLRQTARIHFSRISKTLKYEFVRGFIMLGEFNHAFNNKISIDARYIKYYPYLNISYWINKRLRQTLQAAAGTADTRLATHSVAYGIYHVELRTEWYKKPTFHYFFAVQASQKMQESQSVWTGPFYLSSLTHVYSPNQYAVPKVFQVQTGVVKMNLFSGLMLHAFLQASSINFEQGLQLTLKDNREVYSPFQIPQQMKLMTQLNIDKYFHTWKLKYNLMGNINSILQPQRINEINYNTNMRFMQVENRLNTHWKKSVNITTFYTITLSRSMISKGNESATMAMNRLGFMINYSIVRKGLIQIKYGYDWSSQSGSFHALDGMVSYPAGKRWKLSMNASNLLNKRYYSFIQASESGTTIYSRQLTGRSIMTGIQYLF